MQAATFAPQAAFEAASDYSATLTGWALLILGGSVVALLQRSYLRPESRLVRFTYLLFVIGWGFLARSIYFGTRVQQVSLSFLFQKTPDFKELRSAINLDLLKQVHSLEYGLAAFGIWLSVYLAWWILTRQKTSDV